MLMLVKKIIKTKQKATKTKGNPPQNPTKINPTLGEQVITQWLLGQNDDHMHYILHFLTVRSDFDEVL